MRPNHLVSRPLALLWGLVAGVSLPLVAHAQASASNFTTGYRWDAVSRLAGTISPDPDGTGPLKYAAVRNTYDTDGLLIKVEKGELSTWQSESVLPANWGSAFTVQTTTEMTYNALGLKETELVKGSGGTTVSLTQYSYDAADRLECTAVRMNPAAWAALPSSACTLGAQGSNGPDRITKNVYDAAGQVLQVRKAVGTSIEIADVTYTYTPNSKIEYVIDANGNKAKLEYDGYDRQSKWIFPSKTRPSSFNPSTPATALSSAGSINTSDYEQYTYDANDNRTSLGKRDGRKIAYTYDALNRVTKKDLCSSGTASCTAIPSTHRRDVFYAYDLRGLQTYARYSSASGVGVSYAYDGFGRLTSETQNTDGTSRTISSQYDANGNRTRITHPDGKYWTSNYDGLNRLTNVRQTSTIMGTASYNNRGLPSQMNWTYAASSNNKSTFGYDTTSRLSSLGIDINGTSKDVSWNYTRNPASQILTETQSNDSYSWDGHVNVTRNYTANGLNQYTGAGSASFCYDANGNLTADGSSVYLYDVENRLVEKRAQTNTNCAALSYAGTLQAELRYDPTGRVYQIAGGSLGTQRFLYDGNALVAEYNSSGTVLRRYVHGSNVDADDPLIWYEGSAVSNTTRRYLHVDPRGSIIAVTNYQGTSTATNSYDEYGIPDTASGNDISTKGRFRYTGQAWLPELGMYYYKARIYSPTLGRFLQTDPIGYEDQFNLYAYVANDPVNAIDPTGRETFYVGGGGDGYGHSIVKDYAQGRGTYVQHFEAVDFRQALRDAADRGEKIIIVGHSWGGARAIKAIESSGVKVDLLVTVDPVGNDFYSIPTDQIDHWINIEANPQERDWSDTIASIGGKTRGTGQADVNMTFDRNHDEFGGMMRDGNVQTSIRAFEAQETNPTPCQRADLSESC